MKKVFKDIYFNEEEGMVFGNRQVELRFNKNGMWEAIVDRKNNENLIKQAPSDMAIRINIDDKWVGKEEEVCFIGSVFRKAKDRASLILSYRICDIILASSYTLGQASPLLARNISIKYVGEGERRLKGIQFWVPNIRLDKAKDCFVSLPGHVLYSGLKVHTPFLTAAKVDINKFNWQDTGAWEPVVYSQMGFSGYPHMEPVPCQSPGLIVLSNPKRASNFLVWAWSDSEETHPMTRGNGDSITYVYQNSAASYLRKNGRPETSATQYILLHHGKPEGGLREFRKFYKTIGISPPDDRPKILKNAVCCQIQEVCRDQFEEWSFAGWRKKLPYFKDLGINIIYLPTICTYKDNPYVWMEPEKINPALGSEQDLIDFIQDAHALGIKVILEFLSEPFHRDSPYVKKHPEWFAKNEDGKMYTPFAYEPKIANNHAHKGFLNFLFNLVIGWVKKYDVDGFRIDAPSYRQPNWDSSISYQASHHCYGSLGWIERLKDKLKRIKPEAIIICESWGPLFWKIGHAVYGAHEHNMAKALVTGAISAQGYMSWRHEKEIITPDNIWKLNYLETHDSLDGMALYRRTPIYRALMAINLFSSGPLVTMCGQEKGEEEFYKLLFKLKRQYPGLGEGASIFDCVQWARKNPYYFSKVFSFFPQILSQARIYKGDIFLLLICFNTKIWPYIPLTERPLELVIDTQKLGIKPQGEYLVSQVLNQGLLKPDKVRCAGKELAKIVMRFEPFQPYVLRIATSKKHKGNRNEQDQEN